MAIRRGSLGLKKFRKPVAQQVKKKPAAFGVIGRAVGGSIKKKISSPSKPRAASRKPSVLGRVGGTVGGTARKPKRRSKRIGAGLAKPGSMVRKMKSKPRKIGNKINYKKIGSFARPSKPVTRKARLRSAIKKRRS